jgi:hypothetical protein
LDTEAAETERWMVGYSVDWINGLVDGWIGAGGGGGWGGAAADSFAEVDSGGGCELAVLPEVPGGSDDLENRLGRLDRLERGGEWSVGAWVDVSVGLASVSLEEPSFTIFDIIFFIFITFSLSTDIRRNLSDLAWLTRVTHLPHFV